MSEAAQRPLRGMSYRQARLLVLAAGLVILLVTALVMYVRRVETVEVAAILFFLPIFVAFVFWDVVGGLVAGIAASLGYVALRLPAIHAVGGRHFLGLIVSRSLAFIAFGVIGGLADRQLESSLTKLDLYDQVDDHTGLYNARFLVQDTDLEMSRSKRYHTIFSVAVVDIPVEALHGLGRRATAGTASTGPGPARQRSQRRPRRVRRRRHVPPPSPSSCPRRARKGSRSSPTGWPRRSPICSRRRAPPWERAGSPARRSPSPTTRPSRSLRGVRGNRQGRASRDCGF